ncbi:hypothetical protein HPP92_000643 [Vanilla planifolia]|uniref:GYF domain-containing protein n=1 Tax=Vanilla planifolia TaxID=51239 RepID=A0A835RYF1_VANPL|nr:hypothetical protein HPP92_000643 [Vanilla planifolia]
MEHVVPKKNCFAAITEDNIKSIYLKRSLIVELLEDPMTFQTKVVGCFVRRKNDTKDFYGPPPKMYQLDQIIGVAKASEAYKLGDTNVEVVLRVANYWKDVHISMLSDDYFEEEECEALQQLVKKGLFKKPTIDELKQKIKAVHEDIVKHSVRKELLRLDKLIERANEKGWRKEYPYVVDIDEDSDEDTANGNLVLKNQEKIWNYMDPSGNVQGPFCLGTLKYWKDEGFFDEDFRIWKSQKYEQLRYIYYKILEGELIALKFEDLKRAQKSFINTHHSSSIIKFAAVIWG